MRVDPCCKRCGIDVESTDHLLQGCAFAKVVQFGSNLLFIAPSTEELRLACLLQNWDQMNFPNKKRRSEALTLLSFIIWQLWLARNELVFKNICWTPEETIHRAYKAFEEFSAAFIETLGRNSTTPHLNHPWKPPPQGVFKLNCDASLPASSTISGLGAILRDFSASPMCALSTSEQFRDIFLGEVLAVRAGLLAAIEVGVLHLMIEVDNSSLASLLMDNTIPTPSSADNVIKDIRHLMNSLSVISITWIPR
ncbi:uncharacterized protein LOC122655704 [Telopea speciosissima]|uniref:uncharacterized protein LOC122655704 n=1 Tax=Telopea speciosissima TaxID=54955 RepID=UPI001CC5C058|nr:uncharacterized protein LOC122655704 [Telopea speciosissima]